MIGASSGSAASVQLAIGTVIDNKYKITSLLGSGGAGTVYLAEQEDLNRKVAIKILNIALFEQQDSRERFEREAKVLSALEHEHLVKLYSVGLYAESLPYLVAEFLEGRTLASELAAVERLSLERTLKIGIQVCKAMEYVHSNDVIHRDLKPQNIMLAAGSSEDYVKVLDFGLAKTIASGMQNTITRTGEVVGTVHYLSPEQCAAQPTDKRSDIYSLACVLYECICGRPPFTGESMRILYQHSNEEALAPSQACSQAISSNLDRVLLKALQKDPAKRYQSMREFSEALTDLLQGFTVKVDLSEFRAKKSALPVLLLPVMLVLSVMLGVLGFAAFKKQEKVETKENLPAFDPLAEAEQILAEPEKAEGSNLSNERQHKLQRVQRLIMRAILMDRQSAEVQEREIKVLDSFGELAAKTNHRSDGKEEIDIRVERAIELERSKANRYKQGLMHLFQAKRTQEVGRGALDLEKASIYFASAKAFDLAEKTLAQAKLSSAPEILGKDIARAGIDFFKGKPQTLRSIAAGLPGRLAKLSASERVNLIWELVYLAQKSGDNKLMEECYLLAGYSKFGGDGMYKEALTKLADLYIAQGRHEEALKTYARLRECGMEHSNLELVNIAEAGITQIQQRSNGKF